MAVTTAVWGIDIGQCALKALRCRLGEDGETVVADAFDYIEYPKILSQPEANREELIHEALEQFLSRNSVKGDKVAIMLPNCPEFVFLMIGLSKIGAIEVPINTAHKGDLLTYMLDNPDARILIAANQFMDRLKSVLPDAGKGGVFSPV